MEAKHRIRPPAFWDGAATVFGRQMKLVRPTFPKRTSADDVESAERDAAAFQRDMSKALERWSAQHGK